MPPPEAGEIEKYKRDGTLEARLDYARRLGGHRAAGRIVHNSTRRLMRLAGLRPPPMAPPPSWQGMPTTGNVNILAMLVDFADMPHYNDASHIESDLFGEGGDPTDFPYESLRQYYIRSSYDQLYIDGDVLGWYTTAYNRDAFPGEQELIKELFQYYDGQGHDFSQYDNDADGVIDYFIIIWAGHHTGWSSQWWAHKTTFHDGDFTVDGKTLKTYSWNYEFRYAEGESPGDFIPRTVIHETGHALGLPDYYDYQASWEGDDVGPDGGVGSLDMMDANKGDHNAFSKFVLDWLNPQVFSTGTHEIQLRASDEYPDAAIFMPGAAQDEQFYEYFIVQNRNRTGNDEPHPGSGLTVWHVDATLNTSGSDFEYDNSWTEHKLLRLMEADGLEEIEQGYWADSGDYYDSGDSLGPATTPASDRYDGTSTGMVIYDISAAGASMSFSVAFDDSPPADIAAVNDGEGTDIDITTNNRQLSANWTASSDTESGVPRYFYAIGTATGPADVVDWTATGSTSITHEFDDKLEDGRTYYFSVKAQNGAGLYSGVTVSDGQTVDVFDISSAVQIATGVIDVTYARDVDASVSATDTANYAVSGGIGEPLSAQLQPDGSTVRLTVPDLSVCTAYEVSLSDIEDNGGTPLFPGASPAEVNTIWTLVTSNVSSNTSWTEEDGPWCIMDDITINSQAVLTIEEGASVLFYPNVEDADLAYMDLADIIVQGELIIAGTPERPVTITSAATSPVAGDWGAFVFYEDSQAEDIISNAHFSYPKTAIDINGRNVEVTNSTFSNCSVRAVLVKGGRPSIRRNAISDCSGSWCVEVKNGAEPELLGNTFASGTGGVRLFSSATVRANSFDGFSDVALGISTGADNPYIKSNSFTNSAAGIKSWLDGGSTDATFNHFSGNTTDAETDCPYNGCSIDIVNSSSFPPHPALVLSSAAIMRSSSYDEEIDGTVLPGAVIYFKVTGTGGDPYVINSVLAGITTTSATESIYFKLTESDADSGEFRGSVRLADSTSQSNFKIYHNEGDTVTATALHVEETAAAAVVQQDTTPPGPVPFVYDGLGMDIDSTTDKDRLSGRWGASSDAQSGIASYWYAIGASPGATGTVDWTDNDGSIFVIRTGLSLEEGITYYFCVKAENGAGLFSEPVCSDGQMVEISDVPGNIVVGSGWNLAGVSRRQASLEPAILFATDSYEIFALSDGLLVCHSATGSMELPFAGGFWLYSEAELGQVSPGGDAYAGPEYEIMLETDWNIVSLPYGEAMTWSEDNFTYSCGGATQTLPRLYGYEDSEGYSRIEPGASSWLLPWTGYWLDAGEDCSLNVRKPQ